MQNAGILKSIAKVGWLYENNMKRGGRCMIYELRKYKGTFCYKVERLFLTEQ